MDADAKAVLSFGSMDAGAKPVLGFRSMVLTREAAVQFGFHGCWHGAGAEWNSGCLVLVPWMLTRSRRSVSGSMDADAKPVQHGTHHIQFS